MTALLPPEKQNLRRTFERNDEVSCSIKVTETIVDTVTQFQHVEILQTAEYGPLVVTDGWLQSCEYDEFIYHETLVHPALCSIHSPSSVLVGGGGEGATVREVLKHSAVQNVTMIDIDQEFVELCRDHLPQMHQGAYDDPRTHIRFEDIRSYLQKTRNRFDAIILDLNVPSTQGNSLGLYSSEFFELVASKLTSTGVMATYALSAQPGSAEGYLSVREAVGRVFETQRNLVAKLPLDGDWCGFVLGYKSKDFPGKLLFEDSNFAQKAINDSAISQQLRYVDGVTLQSMMHEPIWISNSYYSERHKLGASDAELGSTRSKYPRGSKFSSSSRD